MNNVSDILSRKGDKTISVSEDSSVLDAIKLMAENDIGSVLVMKNAEFMGILTERDYTRKVVLMGKSSVNTKVNEIMTSNLPHLKPDDNIDHCMELMSNSNVRYLPVFDDKKLMGVISMTDVVKQTIIKQQQTIKLLDSYIHS